MSEKCGTCRCFDPADGYCVMHGKYCRGDDEACEEHEYPRRMLLIMNAQASREDLPGASGY